jgi:hypothetical protein
VGMRNCVKAQEPSFVYVRPGNERTLFLQTEVDVLSWWDHGNGDVSTGHGPLGCSLGQFMLNFKLGTGAKVMCSDIGLQKMRRVQSCQLNNHVIRCLSQTFSHHQSLLNMIFLQTLHLCMPEVVLTEVST